MVLSEKGITSGIAWSVDIVIYSFTQDISTYVQIEVKHHDSEEETVTLEELRQAVKKIESVAKYLKSQAQMILKEK